MERLSAYPVTSALFLLNVGFFVFLQVLEGSTDPKVLAPYTFTPEALNGEYWRLLTSSFTHRGYVHIFGNMLGLLAFGTLVEKRFKKKFYLLTFLASGVLASLYWGAVGLPGNFSACGASGSIFALIGLLTAHLIYNFRGALKASLTFKMFVTIALIIYVGGAWFMGLTQFANGDIIHALVFQAKHAHAGGFVSGLALGILLSKPSKPLPRVSRGHLSSR